MSEPMTALEIEDVLSSIRRLVSEDLRPPLRPTDAAPRPAAPDKLILTPALRVVVDAPRERPVAVAVDAPPPLEQPPSELIAPDEPAVTAAEEWAEEWEFEAEQAGSEQAGAEQAGSEPVWDDSVWEDADPVAAPVEAVGGWSAPDEIAEADAPDFADAEGAAPGWAQRVSSDGFIMNPSSVAFPPDVPSSVSANSPVDPEWLDEAEAEVIATLAEDAAPAYSAASDADPENDGEMTFEESVLRDLVRDLIREELQGNLGERITRNIRKLVRAEIARALALRDFD